MCLEIDQEITEDIRSKLKKHKFIQCWKVLLKEDNKLSSLLHPFYWKIGKNISNRNNYPLTRFVKKIKQGIHVFLDKKDAEDFIKKCFDPFVIFKINKCIVVSVYAFERDFVRAGNFAYYSKDGSNTYYEKNIVQSAVFTKVTLKRKDYKKHINSFICNLFNKIASIWR